MGDGYIPVSLRDDLPFPNDENASGKNVVDPPDDVG
jgi:hypothetical protein